LFSIVVGLIKTLSLALFTVAPKYSKISVKASVSVISGTLQMVTSLSAKIAAGIKATDAFLAPLIRMVPVRGFPPLISNTFILTSK